MKNTNRIITELVAPDGRLVSKKVYPFRSFVENYAKIFFVYFGGGTTNITYTAGTTPSFSTANPLYVPAAAGNDGKGIHVGSDATAVAYNQYSLVSKIPHGDLEYSKTTQYVSLPQDGGGMNGTSRSFWNVTASPITVRECCIVGNSVSSLSDDRDGAMYCRDIIDETIPPDYKLYVRYEFTYQVDPCTRNHAWWFAAMNDSNVTYSFYNLAGSLRSKFGMNNWFNVLDQTQHGVFAGASNTPFDNTHNSLQDEYPLNELDRVGSNIPDFLDEGGMGGVKMSRIFENVTAEPIVVHEIALYVGDRSSTALDRGMAIRHVLDPEITIPAGGFHEFGFNIGHQKP